LVASFGTRSERRESHEEVSCLIEVRREEVFDASGERGGKGEVREAVKAEGSSRDLSEEPALEW